MSEVPANLTGLSAPQIAALVSIHLHGAPERQRNYFLRADLPGDRHACSVINALATRGLLRITYQAHRHRAVLTDNGTWYARTAIARWSTILAA